MPPLKDKSTEDLQQSLQHIREVLARSEETIRQLREALARTQAIVERQPEPRAGAQPVK